MEVFENIAVRVGSGQEVFENVTRRVGSGRGRMFSSMTRWTGTP